MHANKARFGDWEAHTIIGAQHKAGSRIIFHISFDIFQLVICIRQLDN
jgi:hypothetical protein